MEKLSLHIEYLLLHHDCVIIPDLGAFISIYKAPAFDYENGVLTPPTKEIRFNQALRSDDGLLANSYARKYCISYREGSELLAKTVAELGITLANEGEVTIGRIGILKKEHEGTIVFYPFKSNSRLASETGLLPTPFFPVGKSVANDKKVDCGNEIEAPKTMPATAPVKTDSISSHPKATLSESVEEPQETSIDMEKFLKMDFKRNYYVPLNKKATKISACAVLLLVMVCSWFIPRFEGDSKEERASVLPIDRVIDTAVGYVNEKPLINRNEKMAFEPQEAPGEPCVVEESAVDDNYYLIVATCTSLPEATKWINSNQDTGYEFEIIKSKRLLRVAALSSTSRRELVDSMRSDKFKNSFSSSWIWKK